MRSGVRLILGFLAIAVVSIGLVSIVASRFSSGGESKVEPKPVENQLRLTDFADKDATLRLTTSGKITGDEEFQSIRITVTPSSRTLEVLRGYQGVVERTQSFGNNKQAYQTFLKSLDQSGFASQNNKFPSDETGRCPLGRRFVYELIDQNQTALRLWSNTCESGLFDGDGRTIRKLFELQIPEFRSATRDVKL